MTPFRKMYCSTSMVREQARPIRKTLYNLMDGLMQARIINDIQDDPTSPPATADTPRAGGSIIS